MMMIPKRKLINISSLVAFAILISVGSSQAAKRGTGKSEAALTSDGERLLAEYTDALTSLRTRLASRLPRISPESREAFLKAYAADAAAETAMDSARGTKDKASKDDKESASTAFESAKTAYANAEQNVMAAAEPVLAQVKEFLSSDSLDSQLVPAALIDDATPHGLAEFAQGGSQQAALVEQLLRDQPLMKEMLMADGANGGKYGQAMAIYTSILRSSSRAGKGTLHRLALGTSLELTENDKPGDGGDTVIDPVARYLDYEKAYMAGLLDPAIDQLSTWECRFVTNDPSTDKELDWSRQMLRNYRPDFIFDPDYRWRYVKIVRTDVAYQHYDVDPNSIASKMQQFLDGGGKCGPRAFVGRMMLRAFGIPTWGVRQVGHAALSHWTPKGWTINFGAGWEYNWWDRPGPDFYLETQARKYPNEYMQVLRAQWVGDALGEAKVDPKHPDTGGFWNALALIQKKVIVAQSKPDDVALAGSDLAESNISHEVETIVNTPLTAADTRVFVSSGGMITIPAAGVSKSPRSGGHIYPMKSFAGGAQLFMQTTTPVDYAFTVSQPGKYVLVADVVTVHKDLHLRVAANENREPMDIAVPYTLGMWGKTPAVYVSLVRGKNVLHVSLPVAKYGIAIKQFTLTPMN